MRERYGMSSGIFNCDMFYASVIRVLYVQYLLCVSDWRYCSLALSHQFDLDVSPLTLSRLTFDLEVSCGLGLAKWRCSFAHVLGCVFGERLLNGERGHAVFVGLLVVWARNRKVVLEPFNLRLPVTLQTAVECEPKQETLCMIAC